MIRLKFTTITPLHISNGEQLGAGLDYMIIDDSKFCKLNFLELSKHLAKHKIFDFNKSYSLSETQGLITNYFTKTLKNNKIPEELFLYNINASKNFMDFYDNERREGQKFVYEFINSNGKFYIPASSVKGAILTVLNRNSLGITPGDAADIKDKFVFRDSDYIPYEKFIVMLTTNRPPKTSLICLRKGEEFNMKIVKNGMFSINSFKQLLKSYSVAQISNSKKYIQGYKSKTNIPKGADLFDDALSSISNITLDKDEYLINLGFGGGSWFKVFINEIPKFKSKSPKRKGHLEEAHTSVSFKINNELNHIGWCKLKITEE